MPALMKAGYMQDDVKALGLLPSAAAQRVRDRAAEEIRTISAASRTAWLPVAVDVRLTEAVFAELGEDGVQAQAREALTASMDGPLLRPFRDAAVRLFGVKPHSVLGIVPRAWHMIFRGVGDLTTVRVADGHARLILAPACAELLASRPWCVGTAGAFEGLTQVGGARGRATVELDPAQQRITYDVRW